MTIFQNLWDFYEYQISGVNAYANYLRTNVFVSSSMIESDIVAWECLTKLSVVKYMFSYFQRWQTIKKLLFVSG